MKTCSWLEGAKVMHKFKNCFCDKNVLSHKTKRNVSDMWTESYFMLQSVSLWRIATVKTLKNWITGASKFETNIHSVG